MDPNIRFLWFWSTLPGWHHRALQAARNECSDPYHSDLRCTPSSHLHIFGIYSHCTLYSSNQCSSPSKQSRRPLLSVLGESISYWSFHGSWTFCLASNSANLFKDTLKSHSQYRSFPYFAYICLFGGGEGNEARHATPHWDFVKRRVWTCCGSSNRNRVDLLLYSLEIRTKSDQRAHFVSIWS